MKGKRITSSVTIQVDMQDRELDTLRSISKQLDFDGTQNPTDLFEQWASDYMSEEEALAIIELLLAVEDVS